MLMYPLSVNAPRLLLYTSRVTAAAAVHAVALFVARPSSSRRGPGVGTGAVAAEPWVGG
jgi:hypothetical protein